MISGMPKMISPKKQLKSGDRFDGRPNLSELSKKMRLEEEVEGNPKCNECLGRGLIVRVRGKSHHIDKCGCVRPIKKSTAETCRIFGQEVQINAGNRHEYTT